MAGCCGQGISQEDIDSVAAIGRPRGGGVMAKVFTVVPGLTRRIGPWDNEGATQVATNEHPAIVPDYVADQLEAEQAARPAGKLKVTIDGQETTIDDPARPARPANVIYRIERDAEPAKGKKPAAAASATKEA